MSGRVSLFRRGQAAPGRLDILRVKAAVFVNIIRRKHQARNSLRRESVSQLFSANRRRLSEITAFYRRFSATAELYALMTW